MGVRRPLMPNPHPRPLPKGRGETATHLFVIASVSEAIHHLTSKPAEGWFMDCRVVCGSSQ